MAVAAAGYVAGRSLLGARPRPLAETDRRLGSLPRYVFAAAAAIAALACAWAVWQPQRSDAESSRALQLLDRHRLKEAAEAADHARRIDPLTPNPLLAASAIADARGDRRAAVVDLVRAVRRFPGEPQTWLALADYQLYTLNLPADALKTVRGALYLDPRSRSAQEVFFAARLRLNPAAAPGTAAAPPTAAPDTLGGSTPTPGKPAPLPRSGGTAPGPTPGRPVVPTQ
jgi:tetratricopeptide (TPR) repeat protein